MTPIEGVPTDITAFLGPLRNGPLLSPSVVQSFLEFDDLFGGLWPRSELPFEVRDFFENGGRRAVVVRLEGRATAADLALLDGVEFNLLCQPAGVSLAEAATYCEQHAAFLIADLLDLTLALPDSSHAAVYHPRLIMPDPHDGNRPRPFRAAGAIAGLFARLDGAAGVWKAPAGSPAVLTGEASLEHVIPSDRIAVLAERRINVVRSIRSEASVVWGARTLSSLPEYKYINVRRLSLFLQASLERGLRWVVFEANDEALWQRVRASVGEFLFRLWQQGAFVADRPALAYFVRCDRSTMTQADIDNGRLICVIGFAPLQAGDFLLLRIGLHTAV